MIDPETWAVCVHESSHLTIGARLGLDVRRVDLTWENGWLNGYSEIHEGTRLTDWLAPGVVLVDWLTVLLAGETAEVEFFGRFMLPRHHAGSDRERLYRAAVRAGKAGDQALFVARQKVVRAVHIHRGAILEAAHGLLEQVAQAQGADVTVEGDRLGALLDVGGSEILRLPVSG